MKTWLIAAALALCLTAGTAQIAPAQGLSQGQSVYVPIYSHIYHGNQGKTMNLTVTLSIHNIDPTRSITLDKVEYYDTKGKPVRNFIEAPITLAPFDTKEFLVDEEDETGGSGANCIVVWSSEHAANPPIVESVMIGARSGQGISFLSQGRVIHK
jgi:hypothetical protein